jgi:hypothetical protein
MKNIYIARGYNSWTNKESVRAFSTKKEADSFIQGLTDPKIQVIRYKSTNQLLNFLIAA